MANPTADYPVAIHTPIDISANAALALGSTTPKHTEVEGKQEQEIVAIQAKLGLGASPATDAIEGAVLTKQANGETTWQSGANEESKRYSFMLS